MPFIIYSRARQQSLLDNLCFIRSSWLDCINVFDQTGCVGERVKQEQIDIEREDFGQIGAILSRDGGPPVDLLDRCDEEEDDPIVVQADV